jgi:hypothetical protein
MMPFFSANHACTTYTQSASNFFSDDMGWERHQIIGFIIIFKNIDAILSKVSIMPLK